MSKCQMIFIISGVCRTKLRRICLFLVHMDMCSFIFIFTLEMASNDVILSFNILLTGSNFYIIGPFLQLYNASLNKFYIFRLYFY